MLNYYTKLIFNKYFVKNPLIFIILIITIFYTKNIIKLNYYFYNE